ncbi:MAG: ABC transporter permease subunit [Ferruginibacter sp.]|nr:ABC transporter permease subunit [Cytophagales bacterium]
MKANSTVTLLRFDWLQLKRSHAFWQLTALLLVISGYAAFYGRTEVEQQQQKIDLLKHDIDSSMRVVSLELQKRDTTAAWHYDDFLFSLHANRPDGTAALAFGQRDLHKFAVSITTGTYFYNKYATGYENKTLSGEIANPQKQLAGHLDTSFVLVFLLPLYFILISYNLLSSEKEGGTLLLLAGQAVSIPGFMLTKLALRWLIGAVLGTLIILAAATITQAAFDYRLFCMVLATWLYVGCWAGITAVVTAFHRSSGFNALSLVSAWLLFCLAIPATLTALLNVVYPVDAKAQLTAAVQKANARVFATPKPLLASTFYQQYPLYNNIPRDTFPNGWYNPRWVRAMHLLLDKEVKPYDARYHAQLAQRIRSTDGLDYCSPAVLAQSIFNRTAASDMQQMLAYDTATYHHFALWRDYLDEKIFLHQNTLTKKEFERLPQYHFTPVIDYTQINRRLVALGLVTLSLFASSYGMMKRPLFRKMI